MRSLRVLIRPVELGDQRVFVAQCLEFNIAVQGLTPQEAQTAFVEHLVQTYALVHQHGARDPFEYLGQGPTGAWEEWEGRRYEIFRPH